MITPMEFEDDFIIFLEKNIAEKFKLKGFDCEKKKEFYKNPKVIKGFLAPEINGEDFSELPYIIFRLLKLETMKDNGKNIHCLKTCILFGCYCTGISSENKISLLGGSGYRDLWNIMEFTRQALFDGTYKPKVRLFEDTFSMEVFQEQNYPIWNGVISADFLIGVPEWKFDDVLYKMP